MSGDTSGKKRRIFFALPVEIGDLEPLQPLINTLKDNAATVKGVKPSNFHITLKFLGSVDEDTCNAVIERFTGITTPGQRILYSIRGIGAFPTVKKASIIWLGIYSETEKIISIQKTIESLSEEFGFEREKRKFKPHVTIGRIKKGKRPPLELISYIENNRGTLYTESEFKTIVLYESVLSPQGPAYHALKTIDL
jgi:2'-5' RNA ligase